MDLDIDTIDRSDEVEGDDVAVGGCAGDDDDLEGDDLGGDDLEDGVGDGDDLNTITPEVGMEFPTMDDAYKFYNRYALKMEFGTRRSSTTMSRSDPNLVTVSTYIVGRATKERSKWRTVSYDSDGVVISCECKHFEHIGLLCRHALCIMWKKHVAEIPNRYILKRWTIESRHRIVDVDNSINVGDSGVDRELHWGLRYKCKKALEIAYKSPPFPDEYNRFLTRKLIEYDKFDVPEGVDVPSQGLNSQNDPYARPISQHSSNFISEINIRDPTASARHKGRPRLPSRLQSGLEVSQEECSKKKKKAVIVGKRVITEPVVAKPRQMVCIFESMMVHVMDAIRGSSFTSCFSL